MKNCGDNDSNPTHNDNREAQEERSGLPNSCLFWGCLWISSILVAGSIVYMNVNMSEQQGSIKDLTTEQKQLTDEIKMVKLSQMSREREELIREREEVTRRREEVTRRREEVTRRREELNQKRDELNREREEVTRRREELNQKRDELNQEREEVARKTEEVTQEAEEVTRKTEEVTRKTEEVTREAAELKWTLGFFQKFDIFSINNYCPAKRCKPCLHDWIFFQKKCYLFYNEAAPWKTWEQSRRFCQDRRADLVVIDDLQEQEFVSKHVKSYFDIQWGYWLGLQQTNNTWTWVDGRVDTLGFWMKEELKPAGPKAGLMPGRNPSESWNKADSFFQNKFICEHEAFQSLW
ncbi:C-type lectin domain family 4 member G-like [Xiphophorus maculatus]|nr:C-type lectin domain family 4 member G-like [Xiphophorus maculatus]